LPIGLSRLCTNQIAVDYTVDSTDGTHTSGTVVFPQGLTRNYIPLPGSLSGVLRVALSNPQNADITGSSTFLMQSLGAAGAAPVTLSSLGATWRYLDDGTEQGAAWRGTNFPDGSWRSGVARLGFGSDANATTTIRQFVQTNGVNTARQITNYYFRRTFVVSNPAVYTNVLFRYQRDDGCIAYLNGSQIFTNNMPAPPWTANTFASTTVTPQSETARFWTNVLPAALLYPGTNWIAVEVHQATATSSDIAWECEIQGILPASLPRMNLVRFGGDAVIYWGDTTFGLEEADVVTGPWRPASTTNSPSASPVSGDKFFRLRK
jgi:hypothetical protein